MSDQMEYEMSDPTTLKRRRDEDEPSANKRPKLAAEPRDKVKEEQQQMQIYLRDRKFEDYYVGLPGNPKLIARTHNLMARRTAAFNEPASAYCKKTFEITQLPQISDNFNGTPIAEIALRYLDRDQEPKYQHPRNPAEWIHCQFLRIGSSRIAVRNPMVILVTVDAFLCRQWRPNEAERLVLSLYDHLRDRGLRNFAVEFKEGDAATFKPEVLLPEQDTKVDKWLLPGWSPVKKSPHTQ